MAQKQWHNCCSHVWLFLKARYDGKQSDMHICICTFFCMQSFQQIFYSLRVTDPQTFKNNRKQNPTYFDVCKVLTPTQGTQFV